MTILPIGDDDLQGFVDDRLSRERRDVVVAYLRDHPDVAARVDAEIAHRDALRARLAPKFAEPVPSRLRIANIRAARRASLRLRAMSAAAALVLFLAGLGGGWTLRSVSIAEARRTAELTSEAVSAYRIYTVETAHPVEVRSNEQAHLVQWLSKRVGRPLAAPDLGRFGYRLVGGRLLPANGAAAAFLMYETSGAARLTVLIAAHEGQGTSFHFKDDAGVQTYAWIDRGYGFAVSAALNRSTLRPIVDAVYRELADEPAGSAAATRR